LLELVLSAVGTGFILSIMLGPAFFVLLEISIRKGFRPALAFDAGIFISDLIYIIIAYIFYAEVSALTKGENEGILKIFGGCLFLIYGSVSFFKKPKPHKQDDLGNAIHNSRDYLMLFVKGLVLNLANPLVIVYWFSVMALGTKQTSNSNIVAPTFIYVSILLFVFFSIDFLKILGAKKLRPFITDRVLTSLNRITGTILFLFGIVLFAQGILSKL
jgi:threonine/homoserine/homoserine lactone efflux protein